MRRSFVSIVIGVIGATPLTPAGAVPAGSPPRTYAAEPRVTTIRQELSIELPEVLTPQIRAVKLPDPVQPEHRPVDLPQALGMTMRT